MNNKIINWGKIVEEKSKGKLRLIRIDGYYDAKNKKRYNVIVFCNEHGEICFNAENVRQQKSLKCPKCKKYETWDFNVIKENINKVAPDYILKDLKRIGKNKMILVSCGKHDFYWTPYNHFIKLNYRCKKCYFKDWNFETYMGFLKNKKLQLIDPTSLENSFTYQGNNKFKDEEGYKYFVSIFDLKYSDYSRKFCKSNPYTIENIKLWISKNRQDYQLLSEIYNGNKQKLEFKYIGKHFIHSDEKRTFLMSWSNFKKGSGNPLINISKGEEIVYNFLERNNIAFDFQKWFDDCRNPNTNYVLYYDFLIKDKDNNFLLNIEYDGEFHDKPIEYFGGEDYFEDVKYRDSLKEDYMKKLNIPVIRIKKKDFKNIETILTKTLISTEAN